MRSKIWLGLTSAVLGFLYALLLIVLRLVHNTALPGWTALIVIILMLGGIQMLILGVIGEYLWRTLDETKHRPLFVVEKIVKA